jgi:hypothetical protein
MYGSTNKARRNSSALIGAVAAAAVLAGLALSWGSGPEPVTVAQAERVTCAVFDGVVAENLVTAGHDIAFSSNTDGSGRWTVDGVYVGTAPAEDVDFTACGPVAVMRAVVEAQP